MNKKLDIKRHCFYCGTRDDNVSRVADPYTEEMFDIVDMVWLCDPCYNERCRAV